MSKKELYQDTADTSDLENLSAKLADDLRQHVLAINVCAWLSDESLALAESVRYVASIATMEEKLRKSRAQTNQTLWESDEIASRYILEEGRLNVVLRIAQEHKLSSLQDPDGAQARQFGERHSLDGLATVQAVERDLGTILRCVLAHVEGIQTVDIALLAEHAAATLAHLQEAAAAGLELKELAGMQETVVPFYLESVGRVLEELGEDRTMQLYSQHGVTALLLGALSSCHAAFESEALVAATRALNSIFESEHFQSHQELHLPDEGHTEQLISLGDKFLDELCKDVKFRMSIRGLTDKLKRARLGK